uniref:Putative secreted protein n=1 Tax=Hemileia vastatrix TaxID=203904 RepID=T1UN97_9BASI|nr:putative secreted protein [Hemileia vastatrix]
MFFSTFHPLFTFILAFVIPLPTAYAHGFLKHHWVNASKGWEPSQRGVDLKHSAFRGISDNTGWIGSKFVTDAAIVCGAAHTPFGKVAHPSGVIFSAASQSAGHTIPIEPGGKIKLIISGADGSGTSLLISPVNTFIQSLPGDLGFNRIVIGESVAQEGFQDQYYPFCGQIYVKEQPLHPISLDEVPKAHFPGSYAPKNLENDAIPGPPLFSAFSGNQEASGTLQHAGELYSKDDSRTHPYAAQQCAQHCLNKKIEEIGSLAPACKDSKKHCLCGTSSFVKAYHNCVKENCGVRVFLAYIVHW